MEKRDASGEKGRKKKRKRDLERESVCVLIKGRGSKEKKKRIKRLDENRNATLRLQTNFLRDQKL